MNIFRQLVFMISQNVCILCVLGHREIDTCKNTFKMPAMNNCSNVMSCKFVNIFSKHQATFITVISVGNMICLRYEFSFRSL
jgi:hypothetical protein